ncbi:uncharacterized protein LOC105212525 isoform X1 [Zeugodacus cucurbitae]|uniref:uncharacterized protein LOC105212525 isoform X1 n=1 Tax=Zeugodacus cucurbitae TaxID=28588 RepID=UPI0023D930B0|nr:uncharacterized protein LOC105212525 isoform X1 [Zeugodacus cucurbitae]
MYHIYFEMQVALQFYCLVIINSVLLLRPVNSFTKITNIQCSSLDKNFSDFGKCRLSVPERGVIAMGVHVKLFQMPVNNISINLSFFKKASGYRSFLYNVSADFCAFMANKKRYPFLNIFFDILLKESNINHTCPYSHDIIVKNLILRDEMFGRIPVPAGEYMFKLMVGAYNEWKADVKAYFSIRLNKRER